jgi:hypothetical protein
MSIMIRLIKLLVPVSEVSSANLHSHVMQLEAQNGLDHTINATGLMVDLLPWVS